MVVVSAAVGQTDAVTAGAVSRPRFEVLEGGMPDRYQVERPVNPYVGTILVQARQFYDPAKINLLARSMELQGLINSGEIAVLTEREAREYLRVWHQVWGRRYYLKNIQQDEDGRYLIVIDGHCRKLAAIQSMEAGNPPPRNYRAVFQYGITAEEALDRQFQENIHSVPDTWEDAEATYRYWIFLKSQEKKNRRSKPISVAEFADKVGRSETAVRGYLRFGNAAQEIQDAVRKNEIPYGKGLILARAFEAGVLEGGEQMNHWLGIAHMPTSIQKFRSALEERIQKAEAQQTDMFGGMDVDQVIKAMEDDRRAIVFPELALRQSQNIDYFSAVLELARRGDLGEDGAFSAASPARAFLREVELLRELLPFLRERAEIKRFAEDIEATLGEAGELLAELAGEPFPGKQQEAGLL